MNVGDRKTLWGIWCTLAVGLLLAASVFGISRDIKAEEYENNIKMEYQRCFTEVVQYVDDLQMSLEKSRFVNDREQMLKLSGDIYRQASSAGANLSFLPLKGEPLENLTEFLNQAGNYAYALSYKMLEGNEITDEEYSNLVNLGEYAKIVADSLDSDLEKVYNGTLDIRDTAKNGKASGIDKMMGEIEDQLHDYPSLIYDGPFSSHLTDRSPLFLEGKEEIDMQTAYEKTAAVTGSSDLECVEEDGNIPAYYFGSGNGLESVVITKNGGYLLSYLNDRDVGEAQLDIVDAKIAAAAFLESMGFYDMKESYYETIANVAVINYSPTKEGYTLYPDLIKVKIALDNGGVIGFESRGYIMYHHDRQIPSVKVSAEEAKGKVNSHVEILSESLSLIPNDNGKEDFCWQIEGKIGDRKCLIYINTQTGAEEKLFLLIESDTGVLAV